MKNSKRLLIAGGGTGGHVLAGIAVADLWKQSGLGEVFFAGAQGGIEEKLVPRAGYSLELLKLGSLNRVGIKRKIQTLFQLPFAFIKSVLILKKIRPYAVFGVGGYASGPILLTAKLLSWLKVIDARVAILEQNSVPGMTNRILGKFVDQIFSAFPGTEPYFNSDHVLVTGNPVRSDLMPMSPAPRLPFTVFIFGGSQGALGINTLVLEALPFLADLKGKIFFIHQTGEKDFIRVNEAYDKGGTKAVVEKFIYNMKSAYSEASLLVCRAGSSTLAEIAAVGRASVLVPFPYASNNHQEKNAQIFVDTGAAILIPQFKSKGEDLARVIRECMSNPYKIEKMEKAVAAFYKPDAAKEIVLELQKSGH